MRGVLYETCAISSNSTSFIKYLKSALFWEFNSIITATRIMTSLQEAPAAERNKGPILEVLKTVIPPKAPEDGREIQVLEVASGTGQHVAHFAQAFPHVRWQPTEVCQRSIRSIAEYIKYYNLRNVNPPIFLDMAQDPPPADLVSEFTDRLDVIICTNMIHITPWKCTQGLFAKAASFLRPGGLLVTYGPYAVDGVLTPESNVRFDMGLRSQNPEWGIRDVKDLIPLGLGHGLSLLKIHEMPANNKILIFEKQQQS